jgi:hypothetical protein
MKVENEEREGNIDQPTVTCREGKVPMMMQEAWQPMPNTSLPQDLRVWTPHEVPLTIGARSITGNKSITISNQVPQSGVICCDMHGDLSLNACNALSTTNMHA